MYQDWKDGELAYIVGLVSTRGDELVPREAVASYLRTQAWAASDDPTLLHVHRFPLASALMTAAHLVEKAMVMLPFYAPKVQASQFEQRWIEAHNILAALQAK